MVMKKVILFLLIPTMLLLPLPLHSEEPVIPPHLAGSWYPEKKEDLKKMLRTFLDKSLPVSPVLKKEKLIGIISPHAGIIYSGWTAMSGYKLLKDRGFKTFIIMGPSHYHYFAGIRLLDKGFFRTPLGDVPIDSEIAEKILKECPFASVDRSVFLKEHSVEIELPFIQYALGRDFKVVPILFGSRTITQAEKLGEILHRILKERDGVLVVASSDLSHYHSEDAAFYLDRRTLDFVKDANPEGLFDCAMEGSCEACGLSPIISLIAYAKLCGARKGTVISYSTSGMVTGNRSRVVGYGSVAFFKEDATGSSDLGFTEEDGRFLVRTARKTIEDFFETEEGKQNTGNIPAKLRSKNFGLFVTLTRRGFLRGCIGNIYGGKPLYELVRDMAIQAAFNDPRFRPLEKWETVDLSIEVSILSKPIPIKDLKNVKVGRDGLIVRMGGRSGLLLPQVPVEFGWGRMMFIERTCEKAGLPASCWKEGAKFYTFKAQIF